MTTNVLFSISQVLIHLEDILSIFSMFFNLLSDIKLVSGLLQLKELELGKHLFYFSF